MKCKQCRSLILGQGERNMTDRESLMLTEHLSRCPECLGFKNERQVLVGLIKARGAPELSPELERKTREKCHLALRATGTTKESTGTPAGWFGIPRGILVSLFVLVAITLVLILTGFGEFPNGNALSPGDLLTLMLVLQNAVMLLFSPVLFRKYGQFRFRTFREVKNG